MHNYFRVPPDARLLFGFAYYPRRPAVVPLGFRHAAFGTEGFAADLDDDVAALDDSPAKLLRAAIR